MAYAQIAQKEFVEQREDGTSITYRVTFEQNGAAADTLDIPMIEDIVITHGSRQDNIDKPLKVSKCELHFKDVPAATDLIYRIDGAKIREIRITVEDVTNSYIEFIGYVVPDRSDFQLYEAAQNVPILATGNLQFMEDAIADNSLRTIRQTGLDVNTASALSRPVDVFTSLRHTGQIASNPIPNWIRGNQKMMAGNEDGANLLDAVAGMCAAYGWQIFQRNGRLTIAEVYERAFNPDAVNSYIDDGSGNYTQTTQDVRVALNSSNVIRGGSFRQTQPIKRRTQQFNLITRDLVPPLNNDADETLWSTTSTFENSIGLVQAGDVITVELFGKLYGSDQLQSVDWTGEVANVKLRSLTGASDITVLTISDTYVLAADVIPDVQWGSFTPVVFEVPEGFIGTVEVNHIFEGGTFNTGSGSELDKSVADRSRVTVDPVNSGAGEMYQLFDGLSDDTLGEKFMRSFFLSDKNKYTDGQAFEFSTDGVSFSDTDVWIDTGGDDKLAAVTARRISDVMVGSGLKFSVQLRATTRCDLMTVFTIVDNNGVTHTCLPLEIKHSVLRGFYTVRLREVNDQRNAAGDADSYDFQPRGSTAAGTASTGDGGGSGAVWGSITGTLAAQTDLQGELDARVDKSSAETVGGEKTFSANATFQQNVDAQSGKFNNYLQLPVGADKFS